jgi:hypothetical protein
VDLSGGSVVRRAVALIQTRNARILISAGIIALLLTRLDLRQAADALAGVRWDLFILAMMTFAGSLVLGTCQWMILLKVQDIGLGFRKSLSFYFVGAFFNNFLPANIGGDIVRVYDVYGESGRSGAAIAATVTDRLFGMVALALLAIPAGVYAALRYRELGLERSFGMWSLAIVLAFAGILGLTTVLIYSRRLSVALARVARPVLFGSLRDRFKKIYESFHVYRHRPGSLAAVLAVALGVQTLRVLVHFEISEAMGLDIPLLYFFLFVPVIAIFIAMPISIGGLGIREGLGVVFYTRAVPGLVDEQAFALGLLAYVVGILVSLGGGVVYLTRGPSARRIEQEISKEALTDADGA